MTRLGRPLARLLGEAILEATPLSPGYDDHANDLWRVATPDRTVVLRAPRPTMGDPANPFWAGARMLFGHDPRDPGPTAALHNHLREDLGLPAPRVLASGCADGQPWLATELLPGHALPDLTSAADSLLTQLGAWLARLHGDATTTWGDLAGRQREPLETFPRRLAGTIGALTRQFHPDEPAFTAALPGITNRIATMPVPASAAPIMLDIDPTQFLCEGECLTGLIDTDAVVLGPPELELVALEPLLDARGAAAFRAGYGPLPALNSLRSPYRFLCLLMEVQGAVPLTDWMDAPHWLDGETSAGR